MGNVWLEKERKGGKNQREEAKASCSSALKRVFQGSGGQSAGPGANSYFRARSQKGEIHSKAFSSESAEDRHSHMWQRSWRAAETKKPCLWWPALYPNLTLPSPSFLTRTHQVVDNGAFLPTSTVCYEWHIFFYWAFSIMDNTFIQTFSPSKNMMKYKTGILH